MDGSALYGSDDKRAKMLRLYEGGLMKTSQDGSYMPIEKSHAPATHDCSIPSYANQDKRCFAAGNQSPNMGLWIKSSSCPLRLDIETLNLNVFPPATCSKPFPVKPNTRPPANLCNCLGLNFRCFVRKTGQRDFLSHHRILVYIFRGQEIQRMEWSYRHP